MSAEGAPQATLLIYEFESPDWTQIEERHREKIVQPILEGGWRRAKGGRRGFLHCRTQDGVVYGYFACEGSLDVEEYDEEQQPVAADQKSFERILFLLLLREGMLLVQTIRVYNYKDLTGPEVRQGLLENLEMIFREAGLAFDTLKLNRYRKELSKEEMLRIFDEHDILRVEITNLQGMRVPEHVRLFNPDFNADEFLRAVIDEDLEKAQLSIWEGEHLQTTKIVKGLITAGSPQLVRGIDEYGAVRDWEKSAPEDISLDLNTTAPYFPEDDLARLLDYLRRRFGLFHDRLIGIQQRQEGGNSDLPLFGDHLD
jgi:hypothetical protein